MWQSFGKLFQIPLVVRAVIIDTFVNTEVFTVFDRLECMPAVRAPEFERGNNVFSGNKGLPADLAFELPTAAGIVIDVFMRGVAERTYGICRCGTRLAFLSFHRLEGFPIAETVILVPEFPVLFDEGLDDRQFVREEFLILRAVDFIMGPLFERDVSADKENKPADLAILFLNDSK